MSPVNASTNTAPAPDAEGAFWSEALTRVRELARANPQGSRSVQEEFADPDDFAEWLYDQLPVRSPWDRVVGPFYTTEQLTNRLKVSRQALFDRVRRRTLLGLRTSDGQIVYPVFQFHGGRVISGLSGVLQITADVVDDWTFASWLVAPQPELGMSVVDAIRKFGASDEVLRAAELAKKRWSR